ncbi:MAG: hypothetical protein ACRCWQ_12600 [Bacilli bacterium]
MNELMNLNENNKVTSLELVEQINFFRADIDGKNPLRHDTLRNIIKDEFEDEIKTQEILGLEIKTKSGQTALAYELTPSQAKQVLVRESKSVRKAVIKYIEVLEQRIAALKPLDSYQIEDSLERALRWAEEEKQRRLLQATVIEQAPLVEIAVKRLSKDGCMSITDVTKTFGLKRGALTNYARELGMLHKMNAEVNKRGEEYFKVYDNNGYRAIGVTEAGIRWVQSLITDGELSVRNEDGGKKHA